ncbi:uncharacterized protein PODANS_4_490 [Podospora anserina S mat+]|uniref:Podospora anserina S mat+ genomic DNA chromosome 4, supercontig 1 n=1 Tax=Podospora anserina (strain S / ATCC MYA-4624 / DSM 980 / FGSC 10383) TaxID=515849 RepID=B2AD97_PODAN|nr:uncharacterized protein PODANS_4_490 [Podospora anserina S mat+]CAP61412.1 unnamed protein product [Podospora anserina S mat+]CDP27767.1 Putative protein of unknown function [Podospora anserina S mat+]
MLYSPELTMNSHGSSSHERGHSRRSSLTSSHPSSRRRHSNHPRPGLAGTAENGPPTAQSSPKMPRMVRFMTAGHQVASGRVQKQSHHVERGASESPAARAATQMLRRTSGRPASSHADMPAMRPPPHSPRPSHHLQSSRSSHSHSPRSPRHARTPSSASLSGSLPPGQQAEMFQPQQRRKRRAVSPLRISPDPRQDEETQEDMVDTQPVTETPLSKTPRTPLADITPPTSASSQETIDCRSDDWDEPSQDENDQQVERAPPRQRTLSQSVDLLTEGEVRSLLVLYAKSDPSLSHFIHEVSLSRVERPSGRALTAKG